MVSGACTSHSRRAVSLILALGLLLAAWQSLPEPYKIRHSVNPWRRLDVLQTGFDHREATSSDRRNKTPTVNGSWPITYVGATSENSTTKSVTTSSPTEVELAPEGAQQLKSLYSSVKVVARWDSARLNPHLYIPEGVFRNCPVSSCRVLGKNETLDQADALIINTRDNELLNNPELFPNRTRPDQIYVFYNIEAPLRVEGRLSHPTFHDQFNLTMTYRLDSDVPIPQVRLSKRASKLDDLNIDLSAKNKMALWIITNCDKIGSQRRRYAEELARYIDIDIFGGCSPNNLTCPRDKPDYCWQMAQTKYKFYLSFENAMCRDYVTEKLRNPLSHNIVPIALGAIDSHYDRKMPPNSVIDVSKYKTPKELADYLHYLNKNDRAYMKYFDWKKTYAMGIRSSGLCELCSILHKQNHPFKSRFDSNKWWVTDAKCISETDQIRRLGLN